MIASTRTAEHYTWGAGCDGWRLVQRDGLSVIHERMPSGTREVRHLHRVRRQFFFVLAGRLTLEVDGARTTLGRHEGLDVAPGVPHQAVNDSDGDAEFLVVSEPAVPEDRVAAPERA